MLTEALLVKLKAHTKGRVTDDSAFFVYNSLSFRIEAPVPIQRAGAGRPSRFRRDGAVPVTSS